MSIRQLTKSLTEASLKKQKAVSVVSSREINEEDKRDEEDRSLLDSLSWLLDILVQPHVATDVCGSNDFLLNKIGIEKPGRYRNVSIRLFVFRKQII